MMKINQFSWDTTFRFFLGTTPKTIFPGDILDMNKSRKRIVPETYRDQNDQGSIRLGDKTT